MIVMSVGRTTTVLLLGRMIQGAFTASVNSVGFAILADTAGEGGVGPAMGVVDMSVALGSSLSPVCGGLLYYHFGYLAVFESAYILIALDFALRSLMLERKGKVSGSHKDCKQGSQPRSANFDEEAGSRILGEDGECWEDSNVGSLRGDYGSISGRAHGANSPPTIFGRNVGSSSETSFRASESLLQKSRTTRRHPVPELLSAPRMNTALLAHSCKVYF